MRLKAVILENFRAYQHRTRVEFENITAFVGKNDFGKSTILEALEIFFNSEVVEMKADDPNVRSGSKHVRIGCIFDDLPESLTLDASSKTTLAGEFLLNADGDLEIHQIFDCAKTRITSRVIAVAHHPSAKQADDLLLLKQVDLKTRYKKLGIEDDGADIDMRSNPALREAIWKHVSSADGLSQSMQEISLDKEGAKEIWDNLSRYLPSYALFRADRPSNDGDAEVQDLMKLAIKEALKSVEDQLQLIKQQVENRAIDVANRTLEKLKEMDPDLAGKLIPHFTSEPKWDGFKLSLTGDDDIPINKRGSGVRRLILLNFFRAEAERKALAEERSSVIYAIEEPEVSQHPSNQEMLISSLIELSRKENHQVILTTHVPGLAGLLPVESLRYLSKSDNGHPEVKSGTDEIYKIIVRELGVLPNLVALENSASLRLLICTEGPTDYRFLMHMCRLLRERHDDIPDIETDTRIVVLPLQGSNLKQWVTSDYFRGKNIREFHVYDRDADAKYQGTCDTLNARGDGSCGLLTKKLTIENYIHPEIISKVFEITITFEDLKSIDTHVPELVLKLLRQKDNSHAMKKAIISRGDPRKHQGNVKYWIHHNAIPLMTLEKLDEMDTDGEIYGWFKQISSLVM